MANVGGIMRRALRLLVGLAAVTLLVPLAATVLRTSPTATALAASTRRQPRPDVIRPLRPVRRASTDPATHIIGPRLAVSDVARWNRLSPVARHHLLAELAAATAKFRAHALPSMRGTKELGLEVTVKPSSVRSSRMPHPRSTVIHRGADPTLVTTYGAYATPLNLLGPVNASVHVPCVSGYGVSLCSGVASAATPELSPADGEATLSTAAFGIASAEADAWLGINYTSQAPAHVTANVNIVATVYLIDSSSGVSGVGLSCAPTYLNSVAFTESVQSQQLVSCINSISLAVPVVGATEADPLETAEFLQALSTVSNATTIEGWLASLPAHQTITLQWNGQVQGGDMITAAVDPQIYAIDSGAGVEMHADNVFVQFQVTESYQGIQSLTCPPGDVGVNYATADYATSCAFPGGPALPVSDLQLISGSEPPGVAVTLANGGTALAVSGTPTQAGSYAFEIEVTDSNGTVWPYLVHIVIHHLPHFVTNTFAPGEVGVPYQLNLPVTGGVLPYQWWRLAPNSPPLPPGLQVVTGLGDTGFISGTPTQAGDFSPVVEVQDAAGGTAFLHVFIDVQPTLRNLTPSTLPGADVGIRYIDYSDLSSSGGVEPDQWALGYPGGGTPPPLPPGLSLTPNGIIEGTPKQAGTYYFYPAVTDALGVTAWPNTKAVPGGLTYQPVEMVVSPPPTISTTALADGEAGQPYRQPIAVVGGTPPYHWKIYGGLPPGLSARPDGAQLVISGTPSRTIGDQWAWTTLQVKVTDAAGGYAEGSWTWHVYPALTATPYWPGLGTIGERYHGAVCVQGGDPPYKLAAAGLPPGLTLQSSAGGCGSNGAGTLYPITGVPTMAARNTTLTMKVTDAYGVTVTASSPIKFPPALSPAATGLPTADAGEPYAAHIVAGGATGDYQWSFSPRVHWLQAAVSGSDTVTLSGTPPAALGARARVSIPITVVSPPGCPGAQCRATTDYEITVVPGPAVASRVTLPVATIGAAYQAALQVTAGTGTAPYTWSVVHGSLPAGLWLRADGTITGWPSANAVTRTVTVRVTDRWGAAADAVVTVPVAVQITTTSLPTGQVGTLYTATLTARGGTAPYTWSVVHGSLPAGLTLSSSGVVSGTPTATGTVTVTVKAEDQAGLSAQRQLTLTVSPLQITTASPLPTAYVGAPYADGLTASGGKPPYTWAVVSGTLPPGLSLSASGVLSGTPAAGSLGTYPFTVQVTDAASPADTATASLTLTVSLSPVSLPPLSISIQSVSPLPTIVSLGQISPAGVTATIDDFCGPVTVTVAGQGPGAYQWRVTPGLPDGWSLTQSGDTATLTGGPVPPGTYSGSIVLSNQYGETASYAYNVTVVPVSCGSGGSTTTMSNATVSRTLIALGVVGPYRPSTNSGRRADPLGRAIGRGAMHPSVRMTAVHPGRVVWTASRVQHRGGRAP
jgi:hypothetical protein